MFKLVQNLFKCVQTCSNLFKTHSNVFKCVQLCSNLFKTRWSVFKCVQACSNLVQICSNVFKLVQMCSKLFENYQPFQCKGSDMSSSAWSSLYLRRILTALPQFSHGGYWSWNPQFLNPSWLLGCGGHIHFLLDSFYHSGLFSEISQGTLQILWEWGFNRLSETSRLACLYLGDFETGLQNLFIALEGLQWRRGS